MNLSWQPEQTGVAESLSGVVKMLLTPRQKEIFDFHAPREACFKIYRDLHRETGIPRWNAWIYYFCRRGVFDVSQVR